MPMVSTLARPKMAGLALCRVTWSRRFNWMMPRSKLICLLLQPIACPVRHCACSTSFHSRTFSSSTATTCSADPNVNKRRKAHVIGNQSGAEQGLGTVNQENARPLRLQPDGDFSQCQSRRRTIIPRRRDDLRARHCARGWILLRWTRQWIQRSGPIEFPPGSLHEQHRRTRRAARERTELPPGNKGNDRTGQGWVMGFIICLLVFRKLRTVGRDAWRERNWETFRNLSSGPHPV